MSVKNKIPDDNFCTPTQPAKRSRISALNRSLKEDSPAIHIPASPFMERLGYGTGVSVYLFQRSPRQGDLLKSPWAVKKVKACPKFKGDIDTAKRLEKEAELLKKFKHEHIIGYRAFSRSADGTLCLSMENGEKSLMDLIEDRGEGDGDPFPAEDILKTALATAKALSYIHNEHKVLHGDLKSANILIKGDFESIKLCDFGVSVKLKEDLSDVKHANFLCLCWKDDNEFYIGTEPWSAKEVINGGKITDKTDIFAFGLIIWEMLALTIPHTHLLEDCVDSDGDGTLDESQYLESLGTRPPLPDFDYDDSYIPVLEILAMCTNEDPIERPSAREIVQILDTEKE
ncbi:Lymphokine-activated killer T-cell-originated protein kinase [Holothuria leucospilota]|uniref:Lymphokine-activated killer T-cell-originated protein kinase n=1 Tax=Holothuria leucospilota TaxID=206669 RepID=A0A9Q1BR28_HOLLE|nr:Lymphokine-activated killer T-cell-originated protein kinase [Holothuria leucospilota]